MKIAVERFSKTWGLRTHDGYLNFMNEARIAVMIDMTFNLGSPGFSPRKWPKFSFALLTINYEKAGIEILDSEYRKQTKGRAWRNSYIMS